MFSVTGKKGQNLPINDNKKFNSFTGFNGYGITGN